MAFSKTFSGTMGILFAITVFFIAVPILVCSGLGFIANETAKELEKASEIIDEQVTTQEPPEPKCIQLDTKSNSQN